MMSRMRCRGAAGGCLAKGQLATEANIGTLENLWSLSAN